MIVLLASVALDNGLARTPPMGWNPYNSFWDEYDEGLVRAHADLLVSLGLRDLGYTYVNLDMGWSSNVRDPASSRLVPNIKFPGLANGSLATYVHSRGLKLGIYGDQGLYDCGGQPGNLGHEALDAATFASWGIDLLKSDNCGVPPNVSAARPRYEAMRDALNATGRPILFSLSEWGDDDPARWGAQAPSCLAPKLSHNITQWASAAQVGNAWRTTGDISDEWWAMVELADLTAMWFDAAGPGGWNDARPETRTRARC